MPAESARPVVVTGATGNVGRGVVAALQAAGIPLVAADRDPAKAREVLGDVPFVRLDYENPATFEPAVENAGGLFLLRPPPISRVGPTLNALTDVAVSRGVGHVVFSSVSGAEINRIVPHHRVEQHLKQHAPSWTILRPGFFAQNLGDAYREDIRRDSRLYVPAGEGKVAFVDVRDLGEVAARVFADPSAHRQGGYTLTGPEALDFHQVARVLTRVLGRDIRYQPASVPGYLRHLLGRGSAVPQALVQTVLHVGIRRGDAADVDPTLGELLARPPRTLEEYVRDHIGLWVGDGAAPSVG